MGRTIDHRQVAAREDRTPPDETKRGRDEYVWKRDGVGTDRTAQKRSSSSPGSLRTRSCTPLCPTLPRELLSRPRNLSARKLYHEVQSEVIGAGRADSEAREAPPGARRVHRPRNTRPHVSPRENACGDNGNEQDDTSACCRSPRRVLGLSDYTLLPQVEERARAEDRDDRARLRTWHKPGQRGYGRFQGSRGPLKLRRNGRSRRISERCGAPYGWANDYKSQHSGNLREEHSRDCENHPQGWWASLLRRGEFQPSTGKGPAGRHGV